MSNSTSSAFANRRPPAKTEKLGFLHLPDHVRKIIYELAIHDHDSGVVFLPRAMPRKAFDDGTDPELNFIGDVGSFCFEKSYDPTLLATATPGYDRHEPPNDPSSGVERVVSSIELDYSRYDESEGSETESEVSGDDLFDQQWLEARSAALEMVPESEIDDSRCAECVDDWDLDSEDDVCPSECDCICHDDLTEPMVEDEADTYVVPPDACIHDQCTDDSCVHCAGRGLGAGSLEHAYVDEPGEDNEDWEREDDEDADDAEHFDSDEKIGLVYETGEPAILLASTEIRTQCLPIYYSNNAFSWRMFWLDYPRSLKRFKGWLKRAVGDNAKLMTRVSFEGRHVVEEGVEFVAHMGLLSSDARYVVATGSLDEAVAVDVEIAEALHEELSEELTVIATRSPGVLSFTSSDLYNLGSVFVKEMQRIPGSVDVPNELTPFGAMLGRVPKNALKTDKSLRAFLAKIPFDILRSTLSTGKPDRRPLDRIPSLVEQMEDKLEARRRARRYPNSQEL
ncbi:hypothetical protein LTS10_009091 [Elasticomyces elasticus]|nr:hypothetical protein LTS10_009091 [Elasticomyces elasticus]